MTKTMVYTAPGPHKLHGLMVDYAIVNDCEVEHYLAEGWGRSPLEAVEKRDAEKTPDPKRDGLTRDELVAKAESLGIKVTGRMKDETILKKIQEAE